MTITFCREHVALAIAPVRGIQVSEIADVIVANGPFRDLLFTGPCAGIPNSPPITPLPATWTADLPIRLVAVVNLIGLDVLYAVCGSLYEEFKEPLYAAPPLLCRMTTAGMLGRKAGRGFYDYGER